ncbi:MAG: dihydroorotase [Geitlerinemataceae cyanobacterium]
MSELLQQVRVLDPVSEVDRIADVLIVEGDIRGIDDRISDYPTDTQLRDCQGLVLGPGLVDLYSHSGEPGYEDRETWESLRQAAAAGGFTRIAILPDTNPAIDSPSVLSFARSKPHPRNSPQFHFWGALTLDIAGERMVELVELAAAGIVGFTDGKPLTNWVLVRRLLEYLQPLGKPVAFWCCDRTLAGDGIAREGGESVRLGLPGNPAMSETTAIAALLECVAATGTPVHLMRVSTARSVELIADAKDRGLPVTASTTWLHLLRDTRNLASYDPNLRLEPPLGNPIDREALIEGIQTGIIDAIAIDHTPHTYEDKTVAFAQAPPGAIGLELALPLLWQAFIVENNGSPLDLWRVLSTNPARCLQQTPPQLTIDRSAELTLFDPEKTWTANGKTLKSLSRNTSWLGQTIQGQVVQIWGL